MNKFLKVAGIATLVLVIALVAVVGVSLAQGPTPTPPGKPGMMGGMRWGWGWFGFGFGMRGQEGWTVFDAAAKALGLTPDQLFSELHSGKTLADVAQEKGVDIQTVTQAMNDARQQAMRQAIEQAVTDGRITREQADWLLQGLEKGWLGHGFGPGRLNPNKTPTPGSSQGSWFHRRFAAPGSSL